MPEVATEEKPKAETPAPMPPAPPEAKPPDPLRAEFEQFKKEFHTARSEWGREKAKLTRERDSFEAVKDLPEDARARLADLAESREELAEKAGVDPDLIPLADYKTMKASAAKLRDAISTQTASLEGRLKDLEAKLTTAAATPPEKDRIPPAPGGIGAGAQATADTADAMWLAGKITDAEYRKYLPQ